MTDSSQRPHVDTQTLSNTGTYVYEAVATLEYSGRQPSREAIRAAARLDDDQLDQVLGDLTSHGLLTVSHADDGHFVYEPSRRDWSTRPDQAAGHPLS
jgi:hypothetical protein